MRMCSNRMFFTRWGVSFSVGRTEGVVLPKAKKGAPFLRGAPLLIERLS
jgi:hypothetical protein